MKILNLLLLLVSLFVSVLLAEGVVRLLKPWTEFEHVREQMVNRRAGGPNSVLRFMVDPEFGFRPRLGIGNEYNRFGTLQNQYESDKRPEITRLLFIGDSVTRRGKIVSALRALYGEENFEYWNAGVEAFNLTQEVPFFLRFNAAIAPDHVILTLSMNDYESTPVTFEDEDNLVVSLPNQPAKQLNSWLLLNSYLYRLFLRVQLSHGAASYDAIVTETRTSFKQLQEYLDFNDVRLTVLVLPILRPENEWRPHEKRARASALAMLEDAGVRYFDLLPTMNVALAEGIAVEEQPGDWWHPNEIISERFAEFLFREGLL
jgi:hypothetical protein